MLNNQCILVKGNSYDLNSIRDIWSEANALELGFAYTPEIFPLLHMQFKAKMHQYKSDFFFKDTYLIYVENFLCGYVLTSVDDNKLTIVDIAILPHYQRKGIGSKAIDNSIALAGEDINIVKLSVLKNSKATALYKNLGFVITSQDDVYLYMHKYTKS